MNSTIRKISLESDTFSTLKNDLTDIINKTLDQMHETESDEGTISAAIKIKLKKTPITSEEKYRDAIRPVFDHKVKSSVQFKAEREGKLQGQYELYFDNDMKCWAIKDIDTQIDMMEEVLEQEDDL